MAKLGQYDITKMTAQEVADAAALHLFEQSEKSMLDEWDNDTCVYDGDDVCCAAGPFIPNYYEEVENKSWSVLVELDMVPSDHSWLIADLQIIHDISGVDFWKDSLVGLYEKHNLDKAVLNEWEYNGATGRYEKV